MKGTIVVGEHTQDEILDSLNAIDEVAVCTRAGQRLRARMMHFAADGDMTVYLSSMKGDPKILQMTSDPSTSLLVLDRRTDQNGWREIEITGRASLVTNAEERAKALELTSVPSPIVSHLKSIGQTDILDFIRVTPLEVKMRVFGEIVAGMPPTVVEFEEHAKEVSDVAQARKRLRVWREGIRTISLLASVVPVTLGAMVAWNATGEFLWLAAILTLIAGVAIQAGTNLFNDYFDHKAGTDAANREFVRPFSGGSRMIELGLMTPSETLLLATGLCGLSGAIGVLLAVDGRPWVLALGVAGLLSGVLYTAKPFAWASRGFGELLVAMNYGVLMTLGAYYVQAGAMTWEAVLASLPVAGLIALVLYVNEFPDYNSDARTGKRTLVVRLGRARAALLYPVLGALPFVAIVALVATGYAPVPSLAALVALVLIVRASLIVLRNYEKPFDMAPANALTAIGHLAGGLLFALGYAWDELGRDGLPLAIALGV
ncbi:MAG TPA: 1,4-dihydroxy-2-naphthoate octaprenyltransferase, partial [Tepidiformaceae bacterium]|nr:1,4-dihydroxy-2-naphthoate octaprenyltransferase [Tepidiformaceae bacterium]